MSDSTNSRRLLISATCIGSVLEMYDFVIYAALATVLAKLFYPSGDPSLALLATFGTFAVGYFSRPLSGILFSHFSDRRGRRAGLVLTVLSMGIPVFLIGLLPSYATIGYAAPILLLLCRVLQGLSVGGEFPSATAFLVEHAPTEKRGIFSSWVFFGINLGIALATFVAFLVTFLFSHQQLQSWAWRIPFLAGGILVVISYYIRRRLHETPLFQEIEKTRSKAKLPLVAVFKRNPFNVFVGFGIVVIMAASIGTTFLFMPAYLHHYLGLQLTSALLLNTINVIIFSCFIPATALLSDRFGRKPVLLIGAGLFILFAYPSFMLILHKEPVAILIGLIYLGIFSAFIVGPISSTLAEPFETSYRTTGIATAYNFSFGIVGGLTPFLLTYFLEKTSSNLVPAVYMMIAAIISLPFMLLIKRYNHSKL